MSPSFVAENAAIDASSSSLEALIATRYMELGCDVSTLPTANKMPVCRSLSVYKWRGRRGNVALFCTWKRSDWRFQLVAGSAYFNLVYAKGMRMGELYRWQTDTCLPIFKCLQAERATRQRRPLLQLKTKRLTLPARRWKPLLQLGIRTRDANGSTLLTANKNLFANL